MNDQSRQLARRFELFIEDQIAQGRYKDPSEVIEDGLRLLEAQFAEMEALRQALIEGEESGGAGPLDMEEIKRTARQMADRAA